MSRIPDPGPLERALRASGREGVGLHAFASLDSTNRWFANGAGRELAAPAVCVTDHQPHGAGRRGRDWQALPGNLTVSLLQRFEPAPPAPGALSLVTGIAVADALADAVASAEANAGACRPAAPLRLKWPNDLLLGDSKVGGVLLESRRDEGGGMRLIGGIGVNLVADLRLAAFGATSLHAHGSNIERDTLLASVACKVFDAWERFAADGWAAFAADWARLDALRDREVVVRDGPVGSPDGYTGIARGVGTDGALRVVTDAGRMVAVHAGDVSIRLRGVP